MLGDLIEAFDEAAEESGIEKVKTIGDAYLAIAYRSADRRASPRAQPFRGASPARRALCRPRGEAQPERRRRCPRRRGRSRRPRRP